MAQAAKNQEPSMEEILASIRRIIAEDDPEKPAQHSAEPAGLEPDHPLLASAQTQPESQAASAGALGGLSRTSRSATILELTEPTVTPAVRPAEPDFALDQAPWRPSPPDQAPSAEAMSMTQDDAQADEHGGLVSSATSAAVESAFSGLAQTVLVHDDRTLEDLVREMLRPMLKVWLDDNLPGMVERLVRAEIERVSRGRGG